MSMPPDSCRCWADCGAGNVHTILLHTSPLSKVLSIFPAVPASWTDVGFHQLRAGGGLLVSANRTAGSTKFVRLLSENGGPITLHVNDPAWTGATIPTAIPSSVKVAAAAAGQGEWTVTGLGANASVVLFVGSAAPELVIAPLAGNASEFNWWGYRREMQPLH